jgi:hypothetical protein
MIESISNMVVQVRILTQNESNIYSKKVGEWVDFVSIRPIVRSQVASKLDRCRSLNPELTLRAVLEDWDSGKSEVVDVL